jgi:hypothetical protein
VGGIVARIPGAAGVEGHWQIRLHVQVLSFKSHSKSATWKESTFQQAHEEAAGPIHPDPALHASACQCLKNAP